jgi:uncharacterized membrane protein
MAQSPSSQNGNPSDLSEALRGNIEALRRRREEELASAGSQEHLADAITNFTGSMGFVYAHMALYGIWIAVNLLPNLPHFDPTFVVLAMVASVEAIFLSTFVLISQNRAKATADKRDDLDLHINLLAEHELTKLIMLVATIADRLEIRSPVDNDLHEITKDVEPAAVLEEIEQYEEGRQPKEESR